MAKIGPAFTLDHFLSDILNRFDVPATGFVEVSVQQREQLPEV